MRFRKSFLFSLFVITALALIVFTFQTNVEFKEEQRAKIFRDRVKYTNFFVEDLKKDFERSLYVATFRAFLGANEYIQMQEEFLDDNHLNETMEELIINGSINGHQLNSTRSSTFGNWTKKMKKLAERFRVDLNFDNIEIIELRHISPWKIRVGILANISMVDIEKELGWTFSIIERTTVDIAEAGFPDPMYYVQSIENYENKEGEITIKPMVNKIKRTNYTQFWVNDSSFSYPDNIKTKNLREHTRKQSYRKSPHGPTYLMRLEGEFCGGADPRCLEYGIESMVNVINHSYDNIWNFANNMGSEPETCAVDYQFFEKGCNGNGYQIINMPDEYIVDWQTVVDYDLEKINRSAIISE